MNKKNVLLLCCFTLLSCAGIENKIYTAPTTGPTAKVNIYTQLLVPFHVIDIYKVDYATCDTAPEYQHIAHLQDKGLFASQQLSTTTRFASGQPVPLQILYTQHAPSVTSPCKLSVAYTFEQSAEYELEITVVGNRCTVDARQVRTQQGEFVEDSELLPTAFEFALQKCE